MVGTIDVGRRNSGAVFAPDGKYRYSLWRAWNHELARAAFIMLNPSTADAVTNDQTISSVIGISKNLGFGSVEIVNLFAYKATRPAALLRVRKPIGTDNDRFILQACKRAQSIIIAWGNHGTHLQRGEEVEQLLRGNGIDPVWCLGRTLQGQPRHPLYLRRDIELKIWASPALMSG